MVNIWKVGSWPGVWKDNQESRKKFAAKYAIPYDFIVIGSGYLPDMTGWTFEKIKEEIDKLPNDFEKYFSKYGIKVVNLSRMEFVNEIIWRKPL